MKISKPKILLQDNEIVFLIRVESSENNETLWYSLEKKFGDFVTDFCDAPLVALLIPAMANGEDIHIAGAISERLWYNVSGPYQRLLQQVIPSLHRIKIFPEEIRARNQRASGVAMGFSGGIDSYCALADHHYSDVPAGFRITHLLFNNVGSHGSGGERLFRERYSRIKPVAERIGLPFIMVNSNIDAFYRKELSFQQTNTTRNASISLLLQGGIGRWMYASSYSFKEAFIGATIHSGYSDTIALPMLSTEALDTFSVGSEYTRVEKTLRVADISDSYDTLDVCTNPEKAGNCSVCWKCLRTLLTLEVAGLLERYSASFNLDAYKSRRSEYIGSVLRSDYPLLREIVQFARDRNYPLSLNEIESDTDNNCYSKIKLYCFSGCKNLGDSLNKDILEYLGAEFCCVDVNESNLIAMGSIFHNIITDKKPAEYSHNEYINIWGSGFIKRNDGEQEYFIKKVNIHALRGKLSKARCESILRHKLDGIALGDPGLLTSRAIPVDNIKKKYDVGVIPHYVDKNSDLLNKIMLKNKSYKIIDVQENTHQICKEICECRMILSSAMHGLIVADSYGVPNRWIRFSDNIIGGDYKFNDYYSVFNIKGIEPVDLRKEIITDRDIDFFIANYSIKKEYVERICDDLKKAFPRKKF